MDRRISQVSTIIRKRSVNPPEVPEVKPDQVTLEHTAPHPRAQAPAPKHKAVPIRHRPHLQARAILLPPIPRLPVQVAAAEAADPVHRECHPDLLEEVGQEAAAEEGDNQSNQLHL
jgi:hypothetical protein